MKEAFEMVVGEINHEQRTVEIVVRARDNELICSYQQACTSIIQEAFKEFLKTYIKLEEEENGTKSI